MTTNKTIIIAVFSILIAMFVFYSCGEPLVSKGVRLEQGDGSSGAAVVPGSSGRMTTDDLDFYPELKIIVQDSDVDPEVVTTTATFGTWPDDKYRVQGNVVGSSSLDSGGFTDCVLVYYDRPFTGDFKISARVRMTANAGLSTAKGFYLGAFAPQTGENGFRLTRTTLCIGTLFRTSNGSGALAALRFYYSTDSASDAAVFFHAGTNGLQELMTELDWKREYVYEFARRGDEYIISILNSKTYLVESTTILPEARNNDINLRKINPRLLGNQPVYAGINLMGTSAEISEIRVWDMAEPDWDYLTETGSNPPEFETPATIPAYVPADTITLVSANIIPSANPTLVTAGVDKPIRSLNFSFSDFGSDNTINFRPGLLPAWRDENIFFEWITITSHPGMILTGAGTQYTQQGAAGSTWERGLITVERDKLNTGNNDAVFLIVARNIRLDTPERMAQPDYALLQTLPEYYFRVRINRPAGQ